MTGRKSKMGLKPRGESSDCALKSFGKLFRSNLVFHNDQGHISHQQDPPRLGLSFGFELRTPAGFFRFGYGMKFSKSSLTIADQVALLKASTLAEVSPWERDDFLLFESKQHSTTSS